MILDGVALGRHHLYHAARAELLERVGRIDDAIIAYQRAELTTNRAERDHLDRRRRALSP
jgi:RNA polymerase sigma-70 factor (ECF subfamily)